MGGMSKEEQAVLLARHEVLRKEYEEKLGFSSSNETEAEYMKK